MLAKSSNRLDLLRRVTTLLLVSAWPIAAWAVCTCGYGDGMFTLAPIVVDGNMADWAPVHGDVDNNVCDGPSGGLTDRDAPVQSTGRDLTHFAYTWDQNNIYLFTERFGSSSNQQSFAYYADIDNDGLMETGEPVIGVTWRGNNRQINVYTFTYVAQAAGGDLMVDSNGFGDGYTLPGSFANVPPTGSPNRSGVWGSANGLQMEFFITWAELGVAPGSPFTFHVSSSNASLGASSFTQQVDDNLSGCGGKVGSTAVRSVSFTPDLSLNGIAGQSVVGVHLLTNTGNTNDFFDLASTISGDFSPTVSYYEDVDGSGTVTAADILLTDSDGDGDADTRLLAPAESVTILIEYNVPGTANAGDLATISTTAASDPQPLANDVVTDTISVVPPPDLDVDKQIGVVRDPINLSSNPKAIPGSEVRYAITVSNQGAGTVDGDTMTISDAVPSEGCMVVLDIAGPGSGPVELTDGTPSSNLSYSFISLASASDDLDFSNDGGVTYDYVPVANALGCDPAITDIQINPKGTFAADLGAGSPSAEFAFHVIVN
ncbi:MAG: hypothetical protein OER97_10920 [Gammaproteobacteria bacterium]|nr:hypothetical protein [Gammaproteobacteria bacterium]